MSAARWTVLALLSTALAGGAQPSPPDVAVVVQVYDGDTLTLSTGHRVRLRQVNSPELRPAEAFAVEARDAARDLVLDRKVHLAYGPAEVDGYGRLLASVRVGDEDLATHLLARGYAHVFAIPPDGADLAPLLAAQDAAREARLGIWSDPRYAGPLHITSFHANARGDDRQNVNGENVRLCNVGAVPVDTAGFTISDLSGQSWALPHMVVPPGHTVQIRSGVGEDQPDPAHQLVIHLGSPAPIWNNKRDRVTVSDDQGRVVDSLLHQVKG